MEFIISEFKSLFTNIRKIVCCFADQASQEPRNPKFPDGNIKSLLFGKAANKLQTDLKVIPSPFTVMTNSTSRFFPIDKIDAQEHSMECCSMIWANFKFDKQAILDCL